jgi:hypothetical protein
MKISELLNEFEFPDIGGKLYDLTHPASKPAVPPPAGQSGVPAKPTTPVAPPTPQVQTPTEPAPFNPASEKPTLISVARKMGMKAVNDLS